MRYLLRLVLAGCCLGALSAASFAADPAMPRLRRQGTATQLLVDERPFLIRGGELSNSHGEPEYLRPHWAKLKAMNLNTVLVPIYWDVIEPVEGRVDFASLDGLLRDARANDMRLVLLWFGTWKNSMSCYAPAWVKTDTKRFPRAMDLAGLPQEIVTPFSDDAAAIDARAFTALMRHLKETDSAHRTVLMSRSKTKSA